MCRYKFRDVPYVIHEKSVLAIHRQWCRSVLNGLAKADKNVNFPKLLSFFDL